MSRAMLVRVIAAIGLATWPLAVSPGQPVPAPPRTLDLTAKDTLRVAQLNHGDTLRFRLKNGQTRTFVLEKTSARIVERPSGGILYAFECQLLADGQPLTLRRYVCSQESFYEPWVVNGVRIWFSSSAAVFKLVPIRYPDQHDKLDADAVLAVQDATLPICPQPPKPWFPIERPFIDVGKCYNGDDPWLGPYLGQACHMGLDINMPKGTPLYAPLDFDDQWIFSADHRWRGVRRWDNGDIWALQSHHVDRLLIQEKTPLKAGTHYAEAAGKGVGSHPHSHFEFRVGPEVLNRGQLGGLEIDPWIFFWQVFETDKEKKGHPRAVMEPLAPIVAGQPQRFSAAACRPGKGAGPLRYFWTFGDGSASFDPAPEHTFLGPGVYPVTLVVDDGQQRATQTQHVTVSGVPLQSPALLLQAPDETSFYLRPVSAADVYGWPVRTLPHTLHFAAPPHGTPTVRAVLLRNAGSAGTVLPPAEQPRVAYLGDRQGWLSVKLHGEGNGQRLEVTADARQFEAAGRYEATVRLRCPKAVNASQDFRVELVIRPTPDGNEFVIDDKDDGFFATPYFWVGHQLQRCPQKGWHNRYLTNGQQTDAAAIARWTPDLAAGKYEVRFHPLAPFATSSFPVRIRHAAGDETIRFTVNQAGVSKDGGKLVGTFDFAEGTGGFLEILAKGAQGLVVADAVVFRRIGRK